MSPVNQASNHLADPGGALATPTPSTPNRVPSTNGPYLGDRTSDTANLTARTRILPEGGSPEARDSHARQQSFSWKALAPLGTSLATPEISGNRGRAPEEQPEEQPEKQTEKTAISASASKELSKLLKRFTGGDINLPQAATGVYADVAITEYKLRLYALVWAVEALLEPELSLFLILGPTQGSYLPMDTQLTVKENTLLLTEQTLRWTSTPTYLYTQVFGTWEEKFTVEIALPYARPLSLPPLTFSLDMP